MSDPGRGIGIDPKRRWGHAWLLLLLVTLTCVVAIETTLLAMGTGYLNDGFNSVQLNGSTQLLAYFAGAAVLDSAVVLGIWAVVVTISARLTSGGLAAFAGSAFLGLGVPLTIAIIHYDIVVTLGRLVSPSLLRLGSTGTSVGVASIALEEMQDFDRVIFAFVIVSGVLVMVGLRKFAPGIWLADRVPPPPSAAKLWGGFLLASLLGGVLLEVSADRNESIHFGLSRTTGGMALPILLRRATDFDGDGFGWVDRPEDFAPFDRILHPYAPDVPGNGIDENGVGGDHPAGYTAAKPPQIEASAGVLPHFLLIYLESFRADLLDRKHGELEITPFMNRLAATTARSDQVFVHSPWTLASRAQLFTGSLVAKPGSPTLIDDFKARGYQVAHFSGQDDSYGGSMAILGVERADVFYDARQDLDRRTSRTTLPVSLQVSWKTVLERAEAHLAQSDPSVPQFVYVNFVDTHFPYVHDELDNILGVAPFTRSEIRSDNADRIRETYANTAANVDLATRRVVEDFRKRFAGQPQAILITADHGQAFYEAGTLGHGQRFDPGETQVPLIVSGLGGDWPEPIAPTDLRGLILRNLTRQRGDTNLVPRFVPDPDRTLLQYLGGLTQTKRIAARSLDRLLAYDLVTLRPELTDAAGRPVSAEPTPAALSSLIWSWEAAQHAAKAATTR